ncbi:hypothetical protein JOM56_015489 [Amanita muscaria]
MLSPPQSEGCPWVESEYGCVRCGHITWVMPVDHAEERQRAAQRQRLAEIEAEWGPNIRPALQRAQRRLGAARFWLATTETLTAHRPAGPAESNEILDLTADSDSEESYHDHGTNGLSDEGLPNHIEGGTRREFARASCAMEAMSARLVAAAEAQVHLSEQATQSLERIARALEAGHHEEMQNQGRRVQGGESGDIPMSGQHGELDEEKDIQHNI